jgi:hypothetical protein
MENNERLFYRQCTGFNELVANGQEDIAEGAALRPIQRAPGTLDGAARRRPPDHGQRDVY